MKNNHKSVGSMSLFVLTASLLFFSAACTTGGNSSSRDETAAVKAVLTAQQKAWNKADLDEYMKGYIKSDSLRFAGAAAVRYGWEETREAYRAGYPGAAAMGTLKFSDIDIEILGPDAAYVFGRWKLEREKDSPHGLFTVIMKKTNGRWRIVHDHSSSAPGNR